MHERNPYRSALLWIAILVGGVGLVAWFIGMYVAGLLDASPSNDDPADGIAAMAVGNLGITGGSITFLFWLVLSGVTWALDAQKVHEVAPAKQEDSAASS